jgi:transglutaminase-like putative cysteine protease
VGERRVVAFRNLKEKAEWLDGAAWEDAHRPCVRELGVRFARSIGPQKPALLADEFFRFVRDSIRYVPGPSGQEFADSCVILKRGSDNCAGKARLFVALCRSVGIEARIAPHFNEYDQFDHVQAQVRWRGSEKDPRAEEGGWIRAELTIKDLALGEDPQAAYKRAGNRWLFS